MPAWGIKVLKDDPDNRVLECVVAGKAAFIIIGDKEILMLESYR